MSAASSELIAASGRDDGASAGSGGERPSLRKSDLFGSLTASRRREIAARFSTRALAAGETLFAVGDYDGSEAIIVNEGVLNVHVFDVVLNEVIVRTVGAGGGVGFEHALAAAADIAGKISIIAETDATVAIIGADDLVALLHEDAGAAAAVATHFAERILESARDSVLGPEERIVCELIALFQPDPETRGGWRIERMPKHKAIAEKAGVDEAAVASVVAKLVRDGLVERDYPGLVVKDYQAFRRRASGRAGG